MTVLIVRLRMRFRVSATGYQESGARSGARSSRLLYEAWMGKSGCILRILYDSSVMARSPVSYGWTL